MAKDMRVTITGTRTTLIRMNNLILNNLPKRVSGGMFKIMTRIKNQAIANIGQRTRWGHRNIPGLMDSFILNPPTPGPKVKRYSLINDAQNPRTRRGERFYADMVEFGTTPHIVDNNPIFDPALGGKIHPGARPMFFMKDAVNKVSQEVRDEMEAQIAIAIRESGLK